MNITRKTIINLLERRLDRSLQKKTIQSKGPRVKPKPISIQPPQSLSGNIPITRTGLQKAMRYYYSLGPQEKAEVSDKVRRRKLLMLKANELLKSGRKVIVPSRLGLHYDKSRNMYVDPIGDTGYLSLMSFHRMHIGENPEVMMNVTYNKGN